MPDEYAGHAKLAKKIAGQGCSAYFATGEHEYTRFGFQELVNAGVNLLQPDVMWMGGQRNSPRWWRCLRGTARLWCLRLLHGDGF